MALGIRYSGSFLSLEGVVWRVDILQEGYDGSSVAALDFPDDEPLEIAWGETDKLDPVQSSSATLKIISDTDRQFVDLYTVEVGAVRMDVYRSGSLYWSGALDTELYEEPYITADGYDVTLTFADFGCLSRFDWSGTGLMTVSNLVLECLRLAGFSYTAVDSSAVSTCYGDKKVMDCEISVLQENFYDEDGEPMTAREVLEETLRPFAMRIIQKGGKVWLYDLNGLHAQDASQVRWYAEDAVLSADKIYNNVKVTFSPYAEADMMTGEVEEDPDLTADSGGRLVRLDYERDSQGNLKALEGFRFHTKDTADSNMTISGGVKFFQIRSIYSGQDETGVAATMKAGDFAVSDEGKESSRCTHTILKPKDCGTIAGGNMDSELIITCPKVHVGDVTSQKRNYLLRVTLSLLFDVRYNPFESEGNYNDNAGWKDGFLNLDKHDGPYQNMQDWCNFGYVPIKLSLLDADGKALWHYENRLALESSEYKIEGHWVSGEASWGQAYLCYYDIEDRKSKTGFSGWQTNKQTIGYYRDELPGYLSTIENGEYISMPPEGGYLQLEIGSGVHQFDYKRKVKDIYKYCRWILYKEPSITLCKSTYKDADMDDIEDSAWLNKAAKEELTIDTKVGTVPQEHGVASGKGQIFRAGSEIVSAFKRAGIEDRLERLLIGTVYSQYASRHDTLSGTTRLLPSFGPLADQNGTTPGKFILLSETQKVKMDESEILMAEFSEDNYEGIEYEDQ